MHVDTFPEKLCESGYYSIFWRFSKRWKSTISSRSSLSLIVFLVFTLRTGIARKGLFSWRSFACSYWTNLVVDTLPNGYKIWKDLNFSIWFAFWYSAGSIRLFRQAITCISWWCVDFAFFLISFSFSFCFFFFFIVEFKDLAAITYELFLLRKVF